eukprot:CAMPEP_0185853278 /NCGR_PEP_ID=MMETSP1354-20130828/18326_1 /TAXON_ID=708628 /ORGANISM="Erythrolobus madagascarensis, Strain CCMP3276" /LENGTH=41 /DNA_ID= /DNA_START= /DNA_END= /DNA_ORIENTATION=
MSHIEQQSLSPDVLHARISATAAAATTESASEHQQQDSIAR